MTKCAECKQVGGRFKLCGDGKYRHVGKCVALGQQYHAKSTFPFTTRNLNGDAIEVQSLRHLRQLESAHGVQSDVYNNNASNVNEFVPS